MICNRFCAMPSAKKGAGKRPILRISPQSGYQMLPSRAPTMRGSRAAIRSLSNTFQTRDGRFLLLDFVFDLAVSCRQTTSVRQKYMLVCDDSTYSARMTAAPRARPSLARLIEPLHPSAMTILRTLSLCFTEHKRLCVRLSAEHSFLECRQEVL